MNRENYRELLKKYGQEAFLARFETMPKEEQDSLLEQADLLDMSMIRGFTANHGELKRGLISPMRTLTMAELEPDKAYFRNFGLDVIREGRVGVVVLAGGMGTRLGFEHAKGMYDIGISHPVFIFQRMMENLLDVVREAGSWIHLFVMTSYLNDTETREFFKEHDYFGYDPGYVSFFVQDMAPCLDEGGSVFLEAKGRLAMSPNGNGGFYTSMIGCGLDRKVREAGIEYLNVFAVDNVLQRMADPVFVGAVAAGGYASGAKVVRKVSPDEKVGAICQEDGAPSVVEYYDMTPELKAAVDSEGQPLYNFGVILNYLFRIADVECVVNNELPIHVVSKKVPYLKDGVTAEPDKPNASKLETLVLDLVHEMPNCLSFEVERSMEFAPIKNADGVDSVVTARELLTKAGYVL